LPQPWSPYTIPSIFLKASPSNTAIPLIPAIAIIIDQSFQIVPKRNPSTHPSEVKEGHLRTASSNYLGFNRGRISRLILDNQCKLPAVLPESTRQHLKSTEGEKPIPAIPV
jgi:hypothetical protein